MLNTNAYAKVLYTNPIKMMVDLGGGGGFRKEEWWVHQNGNEEPSGRVIVPTYLSKYGLSKEGEDSSNLIRKILASCRCDHYAPTSSASLARVQGDVVMRLTALQPLAGRQLAPFQM